MGITILLCKNGHQYCLLTTKALNSAIDLLDYLRSFGGPWHFTTMIGFMLIQVFVEHPFFWPTGNIIAWRRLPLTVERKTVSDFYWLNTPPAPAVAPGATSTVSRLHGTPGPWQKVGPVSGSSQSADSSLAFFGEGASSGITPSMVRLHNHVL